MMKIPDSRSVRCLGLAVAAMLALSVPVQRAEALSPINPATAPLAKHASEGPIEVRGGHGGGRGGGGFHGGGFRGGGGFHGGGFRGGTFRSGPVFHGGFRGGALRYGSPIVHRHHFGIARPYWHRRHYFRPRYYGYVPAYYHGPRRFCRIVLTYYGPRKICRYRPWHRHHRWHTYW